MSIEKTIHDFGEIDKYSCNIIRKMSLTIFNEEYETNDDGDDEISHIKRNITLLIS
ncbi:8088_t:CDS:1, partial [Entrophospora sp. SA101]